MDEELDDEELEDEEELDDEVLKDEDELDEEEFLVVLGREEVDE
jgi:hypothetical protein